MNDFRAAFYKTAAEAGLAVIPRRRCLELVVLCHALGGANSDWTMGPAALRTLAAARLLGLDGGAAPGRDVVLEIQRMTREVLPHGPGREPASPLPAWAAACLREEGVRHEGGQP